MWYTIEFIIKIISFVSHKYRRESLIFKLLSHFDLIHNQCLYLDDSII